MKSRNLIMSFKYAFTGIFSCLKRERNLKIHFVIAVLGIFMNYFIGLSIAEWLVYLTFCTLVISFELFNTALEEAVNLASPGINETARIAKDAAAGAVLISALGALVAEALIVIPKISIN